METASPTRRYQSSNRRVTKGVVLPGVPGNAERSRKTPLLEVHSELGARMMDFSGWAMPVEYSGILAEHRAVRQAAGLFDVSHMGEIVVQGPEAEALVQLAVTNDITRLFDDVPPATDDIAARDYGPATGNRAAEDKGPVKDKGRVTHRRGPRKALYTPMCNREGGTVDDLLVYGMGRNRFLLIVNAGNIKKDYDWLRKLARDFRLEAEVADHSEDYALLALQGPRAEEILSGQVDADLRELKPFRFLEGVQLTVEPANPSGPGDAVVPCLISRTGYTGEDGFEILIEADQAVPVWRSLLTAGEPAGLVPAGLGARDTLRFEAALPLYGNELDEDTNPFEARLDRFVKLDKGEFVGREEIRAARERGLEKLLAGLELTDRGIARKGHIVRKNGRRIGKVTSGTYAPTLDKGLALAFLSPGETQPGNRVTVEVRGREREAVVVPLPFYRRG